MNLRSAALTVCVLLFAASPVLGYHSAGNGVVTRDSGVRSFYVPLASAVWWDHNTMNPGGAFPLTTGLEEQTHMIEVDTTKTGSNAPVFVEAETFPIDTPDTPKQCGVETPATALPVLVVHNVKCVKNNGYTIQIHYFPWTDDPGDPDHVFSPTTGSPAAAIVWEVDLQTTSYKYATLPPGHWQVWFDPGVSIGQYNVHYRATSAQLFYFDYLGIRGCPFYSSAQDEQALGCPHGYV